MKGKHLLSVDFESWIFSERINQKGLSNKELIKLDNGYTYKALRYLLKSLREKKQKITFFVVTKLEELYPGLIDKILAEGHEVGWHSHTHQNTADIDILKKELLSAEKIIRKYKIKGYQAPRISFTKKGYSLLKDFGFEYSSSTYGNANIIHEYNGISEIPVSTHNEEYSPRKSEVIFPSTMGIRNIKRYGLPIGSSFFWSILGKYYYNRKLENAKQQEKVINMFIHEWQLLRPSSEAYKKDVSIFLHPQFIPYRLNVDKMFLEMLDRHNFMRFIDYLKYVKKNK